MMKAYLQRLWEYTIWANRQVLIRLNGANTIDAEALKLLAHLLMAERIYLQRLREEDPFPQQFWPGLSLTECEAMAAANAAEYRAYFDAVSEAGLEAPVFYRNSAGKRFKTPRRDLLLHVITHGSYHRGQIARVLRSGGAAPVNTDFITFVRQANPEMAA